MARLKYDEVVVEEVVSQLGKVRDSFASNTAGLSSALNVILSARGAQFLDVSALEGAPKTSNTCAEQVDLAIQSIRARVEEIKAYNADVESMGWGKRLLSTVGLGVAKLGEGVLTAAEQLVDGFASALGWLGGIFSSSFRDKIGEFVKKDYVGDMFHNIYYNTDFGKEMVKASYMSENGKLANVVKIFGTAIGYSLAVAATGGIAGVAGGGSFAAGAAAARGSLAFAAGAAGIGGVGLGTQTGLQSGMTYNQAFGKGIKTGAIAAATVVAVNYALKGASSLFKKWKASRNAGKSGNPGTDLTPYDNSGGPGGGGGNSGPSGAGPSGGPSQSADDLLNNFDDLKNMTDWNNRKALLKELKGKGVISQEQYNAFKKAYNAFTGSGGHPDLASAAAKDGTSDAAAKAAEAAAKKASNAVASSADKSGVKLLTDGASSASSSAGKAIGDSIDDSLRFFSGDSYSADKMKPLFQDFLQRIQDQGVKLSPEQLAKVAELQKNFGLGSTAGNTFGAASAETGKSLTSGLSSGSNGVGKAATSGASSTGANGLKAALSDAVDDNLRGESIAFNDFLDGKIDLGTSGGGLGSTPQPMRAPAAEPLKAAETAFMERNPLLDLFKMPEVAPEAGALIPVDSALAGSAASAATSAAGSAAGAAAGAAGSAAGSAAGVAGAAAGSAASAAGSAAGAAGAATKIAGLLPGAVSEAATKVAPSVLEHVATEAAGETAAQLAAAVKPATVVAPAKTKVAELPKLALSEVEKVDAAVPQTQLQVQPKVETSPEVAVQTQPQKMQEVAPAAQTQLATSPAAQTQLATSPAAQTQSSSTPVIPPNTPTATGTKEPNTPELPGSVEEDPTKKVIIPPITDTPTGGEPPIDGGGNDTGGTTDSGGGNDPPIVPPGDDDPPTGDVPPDDSGGNPVSGGGDPTSGGGTPSGGGGSPSGGGGSPSGGGGSPSGGGGYTPSGGSSYTPTGSDYSNSSTNNPTENESTASDIVNKNANEVGGRGGNANEYVAIPDTGVGRGDGWKDYIMPATIGLTAGLIGLGASSLHKKNEDNDDLEEYAEYEEDEETDDEHFDSSTLDDSIE